ncbi:hypothetical protein [Planobispora longispora]|uniref:hypothetical protein n=1 Tax=Planobispora longispora TaxID=28887 RepID=UPI00361F9163
MGQGVEVVRGQVRLGARRGRELAEQLDAPVGLTGDHGARDLHVAVHAVVGLLALRAASAPAATVVTIIPRTSTRPARITPPVRPMRRGTRK